MYLNDISKKNTIKPEKITKPIQLLAAWLSGLVLTNVSFLSAAMYISPEHCTHFILIIASVINVPIFLISIFLLQTKFRPELQEDSYYSQYIMNNRGEQIRTIDVKNTKQIEIDKALKEGVFNFRKYSISINDYIPNCKEISKYLIDNAIPAGNFFGKTNGVATLPNKWIISINEEMDKESVHAFLKVMLKYANQFEGFCFATRYEEEEDDIYIGGYITNNAFFPLTEEIIDKVYEEN